MAGTAQEGDDLGVVVPFPEWTVIAEPVAANPSATDGNEGGLIIKLKRGDDEEFETTRVGYVRRNSKNPDVDFDVQLKIEMGRADIAASILNDLQAEQQRLLSIAYEEARDKIKELIGTPERVMV